MGWTAHSPAFVSFEMCHDGVIDQKRGTVHPITVTPNGARTARPDRQGSIVTLTDDTGAPVTHYTYDAYGIPYLVDPATGAQTQVAR